MVKAMPDPFIPKHSTVYWYRQRVPTELKALANGKSVLVTVDGIARHLTIGSELKVTLSTKDPAVAKVRARDVQDQFDLIWASFRTTEVTLSHKQAVALAGEVYRDWSLLEENPGAPDIWQHVRSLNADAKIGKPYKHPLTIGLVDPLEDRFGPLVDVVLKRHNLRVDEGSRRKVLEHTAKALDDLANLLERRADGDYRPDTVVERFPEFQPPQKSIEAHSAPSGGVTFANIITAEKKHRLHGLGAKFKPLPDATVRKYTTITDEFANFRGANGHFADTLDRDELEAWKLALLTSEGKPNAPRTVHYKVGAIKTIMGWATARFPDNRALASSRSSIAAVELPGYEKKASDISAIRLDEAVQVLRASRRETDARTRWLPWLCAYSGARINELTPLERSDFRQVQGHWFYKIHSNGKRSVKNANSVRYVPVHPALVAEGLMDFVNDQPKGRLFASGASDKVQDWFRHPQGAAVTREGVAPSHGWRHLFDDLCTRDGVAYDAKMYVTGRSTGRSDEGYGKTDAMLPGLAREVAKIVPFEIP